jgi:hypothetical protein
MPTRKAKNNINVEVNKAIETTQEHETKQEKAEKYGKADFSEEYNGKLAKISVLNQPMLIGKILEVRPYWIKFENADGKILYLNKAYIISIEPVGVKP